MIVLRIETKTRGKWSKVCFPKILKYNFDYTSLFHKNRLDSFIKDA